MAETRHVSTRCPRMGEHLERIRTPLPGGGYSDGGPTLPFPCPDCYSVESRVIPWEPPGAAKPVEP